MLNSPIIDVAIGVAFLFAVLATISTAVTEAVARFLGLRGVFLIRGLRSLVDGDVNATPTWLLQLFGQPVLGNLGVKARLTPQQLASSEHIWTPRGLASRWKLPSYISARSFASGVVDLVVPDAKGRTTMDEIRHSIAEHAKKPGSDGVLWQQLNSLAKTGSDDVDAFRTSVEKWYDDHMDRVSGWYKRYTRWITAVIGVCLVVGLNVQVFSFAQTLYTDQALSQAVVTKAVAASNCKAKNAATCLAQARRQLDALQPGLRIGWGRVPECQQHPGQCSFWDRHGFTDPHGGSAADAKMLLTVLLGWILTVIALLPGARFWYDLINRFGSFRTSGPKPATTGTAA